jgi:hypothetical protein
MEIDKDVLERILEAIVFCMDYPLSKITDDEEYDEKVDLQNELREILDSLQRKK